jgi:hypothetical protein
LLHYDSLRRSIIAPYVIKTFFTLLPSVIQKTLATEKKTIALLALSFSSHAKDKKALVGNNQSDVSGKRLITRFSEKVFLNHK